MRAAPVSPVPRRLGGMVALATALLVGGCTHGQRGFYAKDLLAPQTEALAEDTARQMAAVYPPATTYLALQQATHDPFGTALVEKLRGKGYAVAEAATFQAKATAAVDASAGEAFGYVVDSAGAGRYRVTAMVGDETLSRVYAVLDDGLAPTGYWVRRRL